MKAKKQAMKRSKRLTQDPIFLSEPKGKVKDPQKAMALIDRMQSILRARSRSDQKK